jgi:tetratricopeptide (TPR) repeat protein
MKKREIKKSDAWLTFERAERESTNDPAAALPLVQEALRDCRKAGGNRCLESQAFSLLGSIHAILGRMKAAETSFRVAYRSECPCCQPAIDRRFAHFLDWKDKGSPEALQRAKRATENAKGSLKGLAFGTLAIILSHGGDIAGAVQANAQALLLTPIWSPLYDRTMSNLAKFLTDSENPDDVACAVDMLPDLEKRFLGVRNISQERAKFAWLSGGALAKHAVIFKLTGWKRHGQIKEARRNLEQAVSGLEKLGFPLEIAAARVDLAAVQLLSNPRKLGDTLAAIPLVATVPNLARLKTAAVEIAGLVLSPERKLELWDALRELRDATVAAGCAPPLVPYASELA